MVAVLLPLSARQQWRFFPGQKLLPRLLTLNETDSTQVYYTNYSLELPFKAVFCFNLTNDSPGISNI